MEGQSYYSLATEKSESSADRIERNRPYWPWQDARRVLLEHFQVKKNSTAAAIGAGVYVELARGGGTEYTIEIPQ